MTNKLNDRAFREWKQKKDTPKNIVTSKNIPETKNYNPIQFKYFMACNLIAMLIWIVVSCVSLR